MEKWNGTKGLFKYESNGINEFYILVECKNPLNYDVPFEEQKINAQLFVDAGNTIQEFGLLPSELLKERNELLEMVALLSNSGHLDEYYQNKADALISKITKQ